MYILLSMKNREARIQVVCYTTRIEVKIICDIKVGKHAFGKNMYHSAYSSKDNPKQITIHKICFTFQWVWLLPIVKTA